MISRAQALRRTLEPAPLRRSLLVALVIGTLLNAINQGSELIAGEPLVIWKLALTYLVPFAVASYGSYSAYRGG